MPNRLLALILAGVAGSGLGTEARAQTASESRVVTPRMFAAPPAAYRPIATLSDTVIPDGAVEKVRRALVDGDYGSFMFSPSRDPAREMPKLPPDYKEAMRPVGRLDQYPPGASQWLPKALPGEAILGSFLTDLGVTFPPQPNASQPSPAKSKGPGFWTPEYIDIVTKTLEVARQNGRFAVYYDEAGFPSGIVDHTTPLALQRKVLSRASFPVVGGQGLNVPVDGAVQAVTARNAASGQVVDLSAHVASGRLSWVAPAGDWTIEAFSLTRAKPSGIASDPAVSIDPLDPAAVDWFIDNSYERMYRAFKPYVGSVITATFFDDVGVYSFENTWSAGIGARFKAITGRDPQPYYGALWGDIGPDTQAARVGFFKARAELLGEGVPKRVAAWDRKHGLEAMGHPPGNYDLQPTDMNGDPFKFFAHTDVPLADAIFGFGFGRDGYKLISSVSSARDLPVTAVEVFSASGTTMGYRRLIELYVRGANRFVVTPFLTHGAIGGPKDFANWAGRSSMLLQGGRHVADIAILYPIESLQAFYAFEAPGNGPKLPHGDYVSDDTDYQAVGGMLVDDLHRDFTFIHPDDLKSAKLKIASRALILDNRINRETYKAVILPGGEVLSVAALAKIKAFYDAGGVVIATSLLPSKSAEFGRDAEVRALVSALFGIDPAAPMPDGTSAIHANRRGGKAVFIRKPSPAALSEVLDRVGLAPDVAVEGNPTPRTGNGVFGYIHRQKEGKDLYFFGNSSDTPIDAMVELRGHLIRPQIWNPHTGEVSAATEVSYSRQGRGATTRLRLKVGAVSSRFIVGAQARRGRSGGRRAPGGLGPS
ncbi:glycosyl hydrolase [Caulobacter rhizosphaerae]|uniref:glycosyl hydrolase n=1 Tax=Caulobacter rhizosphaerae TaxID=2010972 RepID=UPI0013D02EF2|nr:glycosyl hydrolase [Caulobacter rhizosphaerae]GGL36231.1 hypothetical protein GCM10010983_36640 [Caulobacter rhizosphaerae]